MTTINRPVKFDRGGKIRPGGRILTIGTPAKPAPIYDWMKNQFLLAHNDTFEVVNGEDLQKILDIRHHGLPWCRHWVSG